MRYLRALEEACRGMDKKSRLRWGIAAAIILLLLVLLTAANQRVAALERKRRAREADLVEMLSLKQKFLSARASSQLFANRLAAGRPDDSPAKVIEETGIKGKGSQIRPLKGEEAGGYVQEVADVQLDGLTANEAVNLLYRLEKGGRPVVIRKAGIKSRFDDPSRLDLNLTIALIKAPAQGKP